MVSCVRTRQSRHKIIDFQWRTSFTMYHPISLPPSFLVHCQEVSWSLCRKTSWLQRFQIIPRRLPTIPPGVKVVDTQVPVAWPRRWLIREEWGSMCAGVCVKKYAVTRIEIAISISGEFGSYSLNRPGWPHDDPNRNTDKSGLASMGTGMNEINAYLLRGGGGGETMPNKVLLTSTHFSCSPPGWNCEPIGFTGKTC